MYVESALPPIRLARQETSAAASSGRRPTPSRTAAGTSPNRSTHAPSSETSFCVGQMSRRYTGLPSLPTSQRLRRKVVLDVPGQRIRHHQRRAHQVVRPHLRRYPPFEVTVPAQHRHRDQPMLLNRLRNIRRQRPRVPDARRASIPHHLEPQLVQIRQQPRLACSSPSPRATPAPATSSPTAASSAPSPRPSSPASPPPSSRTDSTYSCTT